MLIVEDEALVSMMLEDILQDLGCERIGPAFSLKHALELAESEVVLDVAILDVNLRGMPIYPVAEVLARRNIPFVFATGYGREGLDEGWRDRPSLQKPFTMNDVATVLVSTLNPRDAADRTAP